MNNFIIFLLSFAWTIFSCSAGGQQGLETFSENDTLFFASYNVENLFDTLDDPHKRDNDYLPNGKKQWDADRYGEKLHNLSRVIADLEGDIIGLVEVENRSVLEDLIATESLKDRNYQIIHEESPDARGIDVAFLFDPSQVRELNHTTQRIIFPWSSRKKTRDILIATFTTRNRDTLVVIMNHWPSRIGGKEKSEADRIYVASRLKSVIDNLVETHPENKIIISGDFNDTPRDSSLAAIVQAGKIEQPFVTDLFYNLTYLLPDSVGTYIYRGDWYQYDQIIVNGNVLIPNSFDVIPGSMEIFAPAYLIQQSGKYAGYPNRTFGGKKYLGGYSDHFPVRAAFILK